MDELIDKSDALQTDEDNSNAEYKAGFYDKYGNIKSVIARNIASMRKEIGLTQTEFAEKLNYSDKAVSKWERAESMPDIAVLKQIADIFSVSLDELVSEEGRKKQGKISRLLNTKKLIIPFLSAGLVWLLATFLFALLSMLKIEGPLYLSFIYAIPISVIVLLVFSAIWGNKILSCVLVTILVWSILLAIYLSIKIENGWNLFLMGAPFQILVILWYIMRIKTAKKHNEKE